MKTSQFAQLAKRVLPSLLPGFHVIGDLCIVSPISVTVRGYNFEGSDFSKDDFSLRTFFFPLCVPKVRFHFTFGQPLRISPGWNAKDPMLIEKLSSVMQREMRFLLGLNTAAVLAEALRPYVTPRNPHTLEAFAYSLILAEQEEEAEEILSELLVNIDRTIPWHQEVSSRAILIRNKLNDSVDIAKAQLASWERETAHNLGIENLIRRHNAAGV
jgi:hypothetical protein